MLEKTIRREKENMMLFIQLKMLDFAEDGKVDQIGVKVISKENTEKS